MKSVSINYALKGKFIYPEDYEGGGADYKAPLGIINLGCSINTFKYTTQMESNFICLPLTRQFKSCFTRMNRPLLDEDNCTNTLFYFSRVITCDFCNKVICRINSFLGTIYGMENTLCFGLIALTACLNMDMGDILLV